MMEILWGLLVATAVSGVVPVVNAELLVVAAAVAVPGAALPLVILVSTLGQMSTKTALFGLARWAPSRLPARARDALDRVSASVSEREGTVGSLVFTSAAVGLPPFYGVSLACGVLRTDPLAFVLVGSAGRAVRFGVLAWLASRLGPAAAELVAQAATSAPGVGV